MNEPQWRKIDWLPEYYSFGSNGRIMSEYGGKTRYLSGVTSPAGYHRVCVKLRNGGHISKFAHRLIMEAFNGKSSLYVNHKNGNKLDNRIENLEYVTHKENVFHALNTLNAYLRGENNPYSKLTDESVAKILRLHKEGRSIKNLAEEFNCSPGNIGFIIQRITWRHVQPTMASRALPPATEV